MNNVKGKVINLGKVMILSFTNEEEDICQRMLQIISESPRFEGCSVLQAEKHLSIGEMKLNRLQ